jgi:hypothetical protein
MRFDDTKVQGIIQGRRAIGRSAFPGSDDVEIGVQLLSERQIDLARFEAQMYLERQAKKVQLPLLTFVQIDPESLDREHQRQVILSAFVDVDSDPALPPEKRPPFFDRIEQVRSLDSVLTQQLWEIYVDWQDVVNPRLSMTEEEVSELVASLKDGPMSKMILAPLGRETLTGLVRSLAARPST